MNKFILFYLTVPAATFLDFALENFIKQHIFVELDPETFCWMCAKEKGLWAVLLNLRIQVNWKAFQAFRKFWPRSYPLTPYLLTGIKNIQNARKMKTMDSENKNITFQRSAASMLDKLGNLTSDENGSQIASFFMGKSIFITGATGFMGKVKAAGFLSLLNSFHIF